MGFWILKALRPRTEPSFPPKNIDLFFTSVSANTVSSISSVEMEVFSNTQLIVMTFLMFTGGEVFTSMAGLFLNSFKFKSSLRKPPGNNSSLGSRKNSTATPLPPSSLDQIELITLDLENSKSPEVQTENNLPNSEDSDCLNYKSIKLLGIVVLVYLVTHFIGVACVLVYLSVISSAGDVLKRKDLKRLTFSVFTVVSTFASCGFVPTNENMLVFGKNSGLLLILIPQVLFGNTLYPLGLRFSLWFLGKFVRNRKVELNYLLKNESEIGYLHLLPARHSKMLGYTVLGFAVLQFVMFSAMEWNSSGLGVLNGYQKFVGVLFQTINSRHTGESIVDLSSVAPAILVLFTLMMYLPPYTSFLPVKYDKMCLQQSKSEQRRTKKWKFPTENLVFSQLSYLTIFVIIICTTERKHMKEDPLNFNLLSIVFEVISAYGNVGFSMGYSCGRLLKPDENCKDKWFGFSGKWSDEGKIILIVVMVFGRLKKFNMKGGKGWKLI